MVPPIYAKVGQTVTYEGYADDYGRHITALEFTFDDWQTWVSHDTSSSDPDLMVHWTYSYTPQQPGVYELKHWTYSYTPQQPGVYELKVRAVRADGAKSPLAAVALLYVEE